VFWVQATISFVLWIAFGAWMMRRSMALKRHSFSISRVRRSLSAGALFITGMGVLFGCMWLSGTQHGFQSGSLAIWAWILISFGGLFCVSSVTVGFAYLVSLAMEAARHDRVTEEASAASSIQSTSEISS
jgi:hypothetical protein